MSTDEQAVPAEGEPGAVGEDLSQLDAPGPLDGVEFAGRAACKYAEEQELVTADFANATGTGSDDFFTKGDVRKLVAAKLAAKEAALVREIEPGPEYPAA